MVCDFSGAIKESTPLHQWQENMVSLRTPSAQDVWLGEQTMNSCVLAGRTAGWGGWGGPDLGQTPVSFLFSVLFPRPSERRRQMG